MLEHYFCARVVRRLRAGPYAAHLETFTTFLHDRGHRHLTVQVYVRAAELFFRYLRRRQRPLESITEALVRAFACRWRKAECPRANTHAALRLLLRHLRDAGIVPPRQIGGPISIERLVGEYDIHLRDVAGLAAATRLYQRRYARAFLHSAFGDGRLRWSQLHPQHVREFVANFGQSGRIAAAQVSAGALRGFLRWLHFRGCIEANLAAAVPRFPRWRLTALPPFLSDAQIIALLATFDQSTAVGRRDFAMCVCMIDLGLRVAEVADLTLADVDEIAGMVRLSAGKPRRDRLLPMPKRVRHAVLNYIRHDRLATADPHVLCDTDSPLARR